MWERLWQLFFPDKCHGCGRFGMLLCDACVGRLMPYGEEMPECGASKFTIAFVYEGVLRSAILAVKYARQHRLGHRLGQILAAHTCLGDEVVVVPIAGSTQRVSKRGYDQAVILAQAVATAWQLPFSQQLVRMRETTAQAKLTRVQRHQNVAGAFVWQGGTPPARIMLVDDICTTGATIAAAITAIHQAGPCQVHVVVLARGLKPDGDLPVETPSL